MLKYHVRGRQNRTTFVYSDRNLVKKGGLRPKTIKDNKRNPGEKRVGLLFFLFVSFRVPHSPL